MFYRIRIGTAIAVLLACSPATSGAVSVGDAVLEWNQNRSDANTQCDSGASAGRADPDDGHRPGVGP